MLRSRRRRSSLSDINIMKSRDGKGPPPSADLLVCFPSRAHLSLIPKPICSPARPPEPVKHHHHHRHHLRKSGGSGGGAGRGSPLSWAKTRRTTNYNSDMSEPTSPKVTCAGQIKVRPNKPRGSCKNWQSVMEEIERMHINNKREKKKRSSTWIEALGFKKDVMQFLTCLRNIRFDFRCFGSFPPTDEISISDEDDDDDDDDDEYDYDHDDEEYKHDEENYDENTRNLRLKEESEEINDHNSKAVFSKWFMILQENGGNKEFIKEEESKGEVIRPCLVDDDSSAPPPNALLLMRCRSAPAKSWQEEKEEEEADDDKDDEEENKKKQSLVVMRCGADFSKLSGDIAKETWVGGDIKDMLSRSRTFKR